MSKIALIASAGSVVDLWRRTTGIGPELAPWIATYQQVEEHGPFSSALCLAGWNNTHRNVEIYDLIVSQITAARREQPSTETVMGGPDEWIVPENLTPERVRPAATFPSTPALTENERVLREFGVNPALIGMISDNVQNMLVEDIRGRTPRSDIRANVEAMARRRHIAPWAETISATEVRQEALRIVQEFYGTNAHFQTMNDSRLFACRDLARRGLSALQISADALALTCRNAIHGILLEHVNEELSRTAGFLDPDTGPPAERTPGDGYEPPAYREAPARRAYGDPLRDHLRAYMQQERRTPRPRRRAAPYDPNDTDSF